MNSNHHIHSAGPGNVAGAGVVPIPENKDNKLTSSELEARDKILNACAWGDVPTFEKLKYEHKGTYNKLLRTKVTDLEGYHSLLMATCSRSKLHDGNCKIVSILLDDGVIINESTDRRLASFYMLAGAIICDKDNNQFALKIAKLLIGKGADINYCNQGGNRNTALHGACECGNIQFVELLLEQNNVSLHIKNGLGYTPLELIRIIKEGSIPLHQVKNGIWTPPMRNINKIEKLLEAAINKQKELELEKKAKNKTEKRQKQREKRENARKADAAMAAGAGAGAAETKLENPDQEVQTVVAKIRVIQGKMSYFPRGKIKTTIY